MGSLEFQTHGPHCVSTFHFLNDSFSGPVSPSVQCSDVQISLLLLPLYSDISVCILDIMAVKGFDQICAVISGSLLASSEALHP